MSRIIFFLALSHSLPSRVTPRKVAAPLVKGPTYAQLQDSRSGEYHDGLLDQSYGYNEENDYHQYHHYYDDHHHHHHSYQPEQKQPPLPSWVLPLLALVTDWLLDIEKFKIYICPRFVPRHSSSLEPWQFLSGEREMLPQTSPASPSQLCSRRSQKLRDYILLIEQTFNCFLSDWRWQSCIARGRALAYPNIDPVTTWSNTMSSLFTPLCLI